MRQRPKGFTLIVVLLLVALLAVLGTSILSSSQGVLDSALIGLKRDKALFAAEAGAMAALVEVNRDSLWSGFSPVTQPMPNGPETYSAVTYPSGTTTPTGLVVPSGLTYILATGTSDGGIQRTVGILVKTEVGSLDYAVLAKETVEVSGGSRIDSIDPLTGNVLTNPASVATLQTTADSILVSGGSVITGDARAGLGAVSTAVAVASGSSVNGTIGQLTAPIPMDPVVLPLDPTLEPPITYGSGSSNTLAPGVYGDLVVEGGARLTLDPGEYTFSSVTLRGGGQLALTGAVDMYLDNGLNIQVGSILNPSKIPSDFKILVRDGPVDVVSGGTGYYVLYAPNSPVTLAGNGSVYGNIIGRNLQVSGGSAVHFDPNSSGSAMTGGGTTSQIVTHQTF